MNTATRILALVAMLLLAAHPAGATQVRLLNLETMTERADRIFTGRVVGMRVVHDDHVGGNVTVVTIEVERTAKGIVPATAKVRFLGDRRIGEKQDFVGLPTFREGQEVVLFLYADSELGVTSPVGLTQGKFDIRTDKQGKRRAVNALGNRGLHSNLSAEAGRRLALTDSASGSPRIIDVTELLDHVAVLLD